jgi:hypothetical protein
MCRMVCKKGDWSGISVPEGSGKKSLKKQIHLFRCPKCYSPLTLKGTGNVAKKV